MALNGLVLFLLVNPTLPHGGDEGSIVGDLAKGPLCRQYKEVLKISKLMARKFTVLKRP